ncbi:tetratricopeptide repeat protein [Sphingobacterium sp. N143]|uniref:tetratricopeptide repeat-containing sensor histidine kinase n=1 Tax=Sphingobacterium sp. N143 TaxID=2746727 RepID=UPI0025787CA4|nr:ATP-binding protein [Sphingobacterium sp. N143]MDM1295350.1 tetratricopeptide repeat protein [Sphingobacterium sp. N143]
MKYLYCISIFLLSCVSHEERQENTVSSLDYDKAYEYIDAGKTDSSFFFFDKARQVFLDNKDSLGVAKCLVNMAITLKDQNDFFGAQETALQAVSYMNTNDPKHYIYLSTNYNNLGVASSKLGQYKTALSFYELALKFSNDSSNTFSYQNNIAICYQNINQYNTAIEIYNSLLGKTKNSPKRYARILSNLARTKWLQNSRYPAENELLKAMTIRRREKDLWGLNASYVHLTDFYTKNSPNTALLYAEKMYEVAKELKSADDQIYALGKLVELTPSNLAKKYFSIYQHMADSVQKARAAAKNQFALIRYEVEKNKTENLRLEKENAQKQYRLTRQRVITGASIFLLLLVVGGGTFWYKRRKQRLELEAQNRVKETQLHLSKKIHDVVANGIYRVMTEIEYKDDIDREGMLDKLEHMYNQSRDISHDVEQKTITEIPFSEQIASLLKSFAADHRRVLIAGNEAGQWTHVSKRIKDEIKHVLQELMVNMKKHSQADQVVVRFETSGEQLKIVYKDNGIGMPQEKTQGKGLSNTVSRIESLGGEIIFVSELGKGLSVTTNIPLV